MRHLSLFFLVIAFALSSCSSEEVECQEFEFALIGEWGLIETCFDIGNGVQNCEDGDLRFRFNFIDEESVLFIDGNEECMALYRIEDGLISFSGTIDGACLDRSFFFSIIDQCTVTISPLCVEGCPHTYVKLGG